MQPQARNRETRDAGWQKAPAPCGWRGGPARAATRGEARRISVRRRRRARRRRLRVRKREADFVEAIQQAVLAKRVDLEAEHGAAIGGRHRLPLEVDGELESGKRRNVVEQSVDSRLRKDDGQQAVLEAIVEKNVGE